MKKLKITLLFLSYLGSLGGGISAQQKTVQPKKHKVEVSARENIEPYLAKVGLSDKVEIFSEGPDRVYARDLSGGRILEILRTDKNWTKDMFHTASSHGGAVESWRYKRNPSLQITKVVQKDGTSILEIDIDRWCPRWGRPDLIVLHIVGELVPHFSRRHLKMAFLPRYTKQSQLKKSFEKWDK